MDVYSMSEHFHPQKHTTSKINYLTKKSSFESSHQLNLVRFLVVGYFIKMTIILFLTDIFMTIIIFY